MMVVGDSFAAAGGATVVNNAFPQVLSDLLGVRDMWNNGVGSTGYLQDASGTQTTFRQRLPDAVNARPDILLVVGGHNDASFGVQAFRAEVTAYLRAARALPDLIAVPIIIGGINGGNGTAALAPFETAMAEAVAAFNDPLVFYFPEITNPEGAWFTGTGSTAALTGSGNCDIYISSDGIHPNDAGHAFLAGRLRDAITRTVLP
jgi:lysophospholipase L1-like esterase